MSRDEELIAAYIDNSLTEADFDYNDPQNAEVITDDDILWMFTDPAGTVRDLYQVNGPATHNPKHLRYGPFGEPFNASDGSNDEPDYAAENENTLSDFARFRFQGLEYDSGLDLYFTGGRFYDPVDARYQNENHAATAAGENGYTLSGNDPNRSGGMGRAGRTAHGATNVNDAMFNGFMNGLGNAASSGMHAGANGVRQAFDGLGYGLFGWAGDGLSNLTGWTGFAAAGGFGRGFVNAVGNIPASLLDLHYIVPGMVDAASAYYQAGGGGLNGSLLALSGVSGVSGLAEGMYGYDILSGEQLNGDERFDRTLSSISGAASIATMFGGMYTGYAPITTGVNRAFASASVQAAGTISRLGGTSVAWARSAYNGVAGVTRSLVGARASGRTSLGYGRYIANQADVEFQTYGNRSLFQVEGQPHHLNQSEILGGIVHYDDGITTPLVGDAFRDIGSPHFLSHRGTEAFFDLYRPATTRGARYIRPDGWLVRERPTFSQYNRALYNSLQEAGVSSNRALRMVQQAKAEQLLAGFRGADLIPDLPRRMGQRGGL